MAYVLPGVWYNDAFSVSTDPTGNSFAGRQAPTFDDISLEAGCLPADHFSSWLILEPDGTADNAEQVSDRL